MKGFLIKLMPSFMVRIFAGPYVGGDSVEKGIAKSRQLWEDYGLSSTIDLLGEDSQSREECDYVVNTYLELIKKLERNEFASISIKPNSLGIHESKEYCLENVVKILDEASKFDIIVTLDMEDHTLTDVTLEMYKELLPRYPTFRSVLQSRLYRTPEDVQGLLGLNGGIRTCIGIYNEPKEVAMSKKPKMKEVLLKISDTLLADGYVIGFATHDKKVIRRSLELFEEKGYPKERIEYQMLLGVPMSKLQQKLLDDGYVVKLYVPFATNWKYANAYLKRRLNNNPFMVFFVIKNMISSFFGIFRRKKRKGKPPASTVTTSSTMSEDTSSSIEEAETTNTTNSAEEQ